MEINEILDKLNEFDSSETKVPTEEDLDDIYDCLQTMNKCEFFVDNEEDLETIQSAYEVIDILYQKYDSYKG